MVWRALKKLSGLMCPYPNEPETVISSPPPTPLPRPHAGLGVEGLRACLLCLSQAVLYLWGRRSMGVRVEGPEGLGRRVLSRHSSYPLTLTHGKTFLTLGLSFLNCEAKKLE